MLNKIKNIKNIFVDVEGATIPVSETSQTLNHVNPKPKIVRNLRTVADMERGKFRRMFNRHKFAYGY